MPRPRPLTPAELQKALVPRFGRVADNLRQLATKFGARPYRVFLVWTRFDGVPIPEGPVSDEPERGAGGEVVLQTIEILPTPNVRSLDSIAIDPRTAGVLQMGMLKVSEVSTSLTYEQLKGLAVPGLGVIDHIPQPYDFFYEVVEDERAGPNQVRRRYRLATEPFLDAENVQWVFTLEKQSVDRNRDGSSAYTRGTQG